MNHRALFFGPALLTSIALAFAGVGDGDVHPSASDPVAPAPRGVLPDHGASTSRGLFYAGTGTGAAGLALVVGGVATRGEQSLEDCKALSKAGVLFDAADCAIVGMGAATNGATEDLVTLGGGAVLAVGATMAIVGVWQPPARSAGPASPRRAVASSRPADAARIVFERAPRRQP